VPAGRDVQLLAVERVRDHTQGVVGVARRAVMRQQRGGAEHLLTLHGDQRIGPPTGLGVGAWWRRVRQTGKARGARGDDLRNHGGIAGQIHRIEQRGKLPKGRGILGTYRPNHPGRSRHSTFSC
jgi:hypothetical protein